MSETPFVWSTQSCILKQLLSSFTVLDCTFVCVFLWTYMIFTVKLKPKGVLLYFLVLCSCCSFYTDIVCCLQFHCTCWDFYLLFQHDTWLSALAVCLWMPRKPERYWRDMSGWCLCWFCCFLHFAHCCHLTVCVFFSSQKGMECAILHTAIYAGQELWHFIFCLFVNVQAEMTCIFQMIYL